MTEVSSSLPGGHQINNDGNLLRTYIRVPPNPVPVMAIVNGERIQIGTGTLDKKTGVFTTTFFDTPQAKVLFRFLQSNGHYSLPVQYSQVEALPGLEFNSGEVDVNPG